MFLCVLRHSLGSAGTLWILFVGPERLCTTIWTHLGCWNPFLGEFSAGVQSVFLFKVESIFFFVFCCCGSCFGVCHCLILSKCCEINCESFCRRSERIVFLLRFMLGRNDRDRARSVTFHETRKKCKPNNTIVSNNVIALLSFNFHRFCLWMVRIGGHL